MTKNYHVVPDPKGGWNVKGAGAKKASVHTDKASGGMTMASSKHPPKSGFTKKSE